MMQITISWVSLIVGLFGALGGGAGLATLLKVRADKRNTDANTHHVAANTIKVHAETVDLQAGVYGKMIETLQEQMANMEESLQSNEAQRLADYAKFEAYRRKDHMDLTAWEAHVLHLEAHINAELPPPPPPRPIRDPISGYLTMNTEEALNLAPKPFVPPSPPPES